MSGIGAFAAVLADAALVVAQVDVATHVMTVSLNLQHFCWQKDNLNIWTYLRGSELWFVVRLARGVVGCRISV